MSAVPPTATEFCVAEKFRDVPRVAFTVNRSLQVCPINGHTRGSSAVRGIVNEKIRNVSDDQAACRSASNLDVAKERETMLTQIGASMKLHGRRLAGSDGDCILAG